MTPKPGWTLNADPEDIAASLGLVAAARSGVMEAAAVLQEEWINLLKQEGSGRVYPADITFITHDGTVIPIEADLGREEDHQASAPDEPPATDRGTLAASIGIDPSPQAVAPFTPGKIGRVRVGSPLEYARYLEWGVDDHPGGITIAPRPHARPAKEKAKEQMTDAIVSELRGS